MITDSFDKFSEEIIKVSRNYVFCGLYVICRGASLRG